MTDDELLTLAKDENAWETLHELCLDRSIAERLLHCLKSREPQMAYEANLWRGVVREIHPDLVAGQNS